jgi:AAA+ ATPase superfamily predicted ATPase
MDAPFVYGKLAIGNEFTNREKDLQRLTMNFRSGINTILISPRRWGKSSLVNKASELVAKKEGKIVFCHIDLYNVRDQEEFYQLLAQEVIRATASKWEERIENTKDFISRFMPKVSYNIDPVNDFSIGLDWKEVKRNPDQIIDLAERIAERKNVRIVVCIDEFQNITDFSDTLKLQKKLRSHWQRHQRVSYCLFGSKRHMMMNVFTSSAMPFYKFGDLFLLEKIEEDHWVKFISRRFEDTGKRISDTNASLIARSADLHPYYIQQLAQQAWLHSGKVCNEEIILKSLDSILLQLSLLFQNVTDSLSTTQVNFLKALIEESEKLSSKEMLQHYALGTSANVIRIRQALMNKEIVDIMGNKITFLDPMYKRWLRKYYFKLP